MALTLGFTNMDKATETALRAAFAEANERLLKRFTLVPDAEAEFVVIDMDSMYGPMGWLRLHAAGKQVVGLTAAARTQADLRLGRPFDTTTMMELLREIAARAGVDLAVAPPAPAPVPAPAPPPRAPATPPAAAAAPPAPAPAPAPAAEPRPKLEPEPEGDPEPGASDALDPGIATPSAPGDAPAPDTSAPGAPPAVAEADTEAPVLPGTESGPVPDPVPDPDLPPREPVFADWMQPGALSGRVHYRRGSGPDLWIDADARQYHGPRQLKPLVPYFHGSVELEDFAPVDAATWATAAAAAGEAQPMLRLQWLGGLLAGGGELLPGNDPHGRYRLTKWPETEREYARHFRIATAMMRGPATPPEIAEASGGTLAEVADFINANLTTGYAEFVPEPEPEPDTPPRPTGFFGRLRGRS